MKRASVRYVVLLESRAEKELEAFPEQAVKCVDIKLQALSTLAREAGLFTSVTNRAASLWRLAPRIG